MLCLKAKTENGVICLYDYHGMDEITLIGSSVRCLLRPYDHSNMIYLYPEIKDGERGIVAISRQVGSVKEFTAKQVAMFLEITKNNQGLIQINVDSPAVMMPNRRGYLAGEAIYVEIKGKIISTSPEEDVDYIVDGNTICGYLSGKLEAHQVFRVARENLKEIKLIESLKVDNGILRESLREYSEKFQKVESFAAGLVTKVDELRTENRLLKRSWWEKFIDWLPEAGPGY